MSNFLPKNIDNIIVPPIKMQGIKTKLVSFIARNIAWDGKGKWIEPFLGTGVVLFNIKPKMALIGDSNEYIIRFYKKLKSGEINSYMVREFLEKHGAKLKERGEEYYYKMRDEFNKNGDVLYMLFLNRSCYNGMMRFNKNKEFNVPFCKKPNRFRKAYITKIVNQVKAVEEILKIRGEKWRFVKWNWDKTLNEAKSEDFLYLDPPYVGRHTGYIGKWTKVDAEKLASTVQEKILGGFAFSMWLENKYRKNQHIRKNWDGYTIRSFNHYYHVGATEKLRNSMEEGLIIEDGYEAPIKKEKRQEQLDLI